MEAVITALTDETTGLTAGTITGVVVDLVPLVVMLVPVVLGIYFLRRLIKGVGRAKIKM